MPDKDEEIYKRAQARVRRVRGFYSNLISYVIVNLILVVINLVLSPRDLWFYWVTLIWGAVLVIQAFNTFTIKDNFLGEEWEEKKINDLVKKEKSKKK
ncbi:MAG: 2TM domain-containing protein [Chlamydiales bacterium]|nr:2TM domain-containing protein [Chlamydiales bacterium]